MFGLKTLAGRSNAPLPLATGYVYIITSPRDHPTLLTPDTLGHHQSTVIQHNSLPCPLLKHFTRSPNFLDVIDCQPAPKILRNNLVDPKTYSLCGISSSWSARTLPSSANKIVIKNPNKILWSIASTALLSFPLISTGTLGTTTREVVCRAASARFYTDSERYFITTHSVWDSVQLIVIRQAYFFHSFRTLPRPD